MGLTACGKDFDAAGYTKSVLDANYHAQYDKYAEYRGISESDAKKEVTEGMRTQIESAFSGMDVGDEMMDKYIEVADKAYEMCIRDRERHLGKKRLYRMESWYGHLLQGDVYKRQEFGENVLSWNT